MRNWVAKIIRDGVNSILNMKVLVAFNQKALIVAFSMIVNTC